MRIEVTRRGIESSRTPAPMTVVVEIDGHSLWTLEIVAEPEVHAHIVPWPEGVAKRLTGQSECRVLTLSGDPLWTGNVNWEQGGAGNSVAHPNFRNSAGQLLSVSKWGTLRPTFAGSSPEFQRRVVDSAATIIEDLRALKLNPFAVGGTLLGAVREGALLAHDDDADLAYLSSYDHPADLILESREIEQHLLFRGHDVLRHSWAHLQVLLTDPNGSQYYVDLFTAFYKQGHFHEPIHVRVAGHEEIIEPLGEVELSGRMLPAPRDPAAWLAACYGPNWRSPDPGFSFETPVPTRRRFDAWFGSFNMGRNFWEELTDGEIPSHESPTIRPHVLSRAAGRTIIDLGAGELRDARAYEAADTHCFTSDFTGTARDRHEDRPAERVNLANYLESTQYLLRCFEAAGGAENCVLALNHVLATQVGATRRTTLELLHFASRAGAAVVTADYTELGRYHFEDPRTWHLPTSVLREEAAQVRLRADVLESNRHTDSDGISREVSVSTLTAQHESPTSPLPESGTQMEHQKSSSAQPQNPARRARATLRRFLGRARGALTGNAALQHKVDILERELAQTQAEIDELRSDSRRVAELRILVEDQLARLAAAGQDSPSEP